MEFGEISLNTVGTNILDLINPSSLNHHQTFNTVLVSSWNADANSCYINDQISIISGVKILCLLLSQLFPLPCGVCLRCCLPSRTMTCQPSTEGRWVSYAAWYVHLGLSENKRFLAFVSHSFINLSARVYCLDKFWGWEGISFSAYLTTYQESMSSTPQFQVIRTLDSPESWSLVKSIKVIWLWPLLSFMSWLSPIPNICF